MPQALKIGVAGVGTVGGGLLRLLATHEARLESLLQRRLTVVAVSARSRDRARDVDLSRLKWFDDPVALARDPGIDVFVELIGGSDGVAKAAVEAAIESGKHVVTANKALLAHHGVALAKLAEAKRVALNFEAAVAAGIPVIKTLRESLVGSEVKRVYGILNGTCNYILTRMQEEELPFDMVLAEAQAKGYAEADPTFDIGGFDTAHKLALLTSLAFGAEVALDAIHVEGIASVTPADIEAADGLGYRIKLLGVALRTASGIEQRVHPAMVPKHSAIAEVSGVTNCVAIDGDFMGDLLMVGPGAGADATASAVVSDLADIARGRVQPAFITPAAQLKSYARAPLGRHEGGYYVRLSAHDRPGVMAGIAGRMAEEQVSLESIVQHRLDKRLPGTGAPRDVGGLASIVLITHETTEQSIRRALDAIERDGKVTTRPQMIRIEQL